MKSSEFILLDEQKMKTTVITEGVFIAKREAGDYKIFLFQMENYYVETFCNVESKHIDEFRVFHHTSALHPYLEAIPLGDMLN